MHLRRGSIGGFGRSWAEARRRIRKKLVRSCLQICRAADLILDDATCGGEGVNNCERVAARDDSAMCETSADAEQHHITGFGRRDFDRAREEMAHVSFFVSVKKPIGGIGARVERLDEAEVAEYAHQDHRAVDAMAPDVGGVMVRRAEPGARSGDDARATVGSRQSAVGCRNGTAGGGRRLESRVLG